VRELHLRSRDLIVDQDDTTHLGLPRRLAWPTGINPDTVVFFNRAIAAALLWRPASFWDDQPACVGSAPKQACQFECLVTFQTWRHQACKLQGIYSEGTPIIPTR
jgi:hypothetical protein